METYLISLLKSFHLLNKEKTKITDPVIINTDNTTLYSKNMLYAVGVNLSKIGPDMSAFNAITGNPSAQPSPTPSPTLSVPRYLA